MKIAFLVWKDVSQESGVLKKLVQQIRATAALGCEARLFVLGPATRMWNGASNIDHELHCYCGLSSRFSSAASLFESVMSWQPDVAFFRMNTFYPGMQRLMQNVPTFIEMNSDDMQIHRQMLRPYEFLYYRLTRRLLLRAAAGYVCVSHELADRYACFRKPIRVIANGIELDDFPELPPASDQEPRLVFLGSPQYYWNGADEILRLANARPDWQFDIVGYEQSDFNVQPPNNVTAHGFMNRVRYLPLLQKADVALGTLGLHRKHMVEASPLKVREYLACGIPTIIGYRDTDFPNPTPFLLQVENESSNLVNNLDRIQQFVQRWIGSRLDRIQVLHLDAERKEREKIEFFRTIASSLNRFGLNALATTRLF